MKSEKDKKKSGLKKRGRPRNENKIRPVQLSRQEIATLEIRGSWISCVKLTQAKGVYEKYRDKLLKKYTLDQLCQLYEKVFAEYFTWEKKTDETDSKRDFSVLMDRFYVTSQQNLISDIYKNDSADLNDLQKSLLSKPKSKLHEIFKKLGIGYCGWKNKNVCVIELILHYVEKQWEMNLLNVQVFADTTETFEEFEDKRVEICSRIRSACDGESITQYRKKFKADAVKFYNIIYHDKCEKLREILNPRYTGDEILSKMELVLSKDPNDPLQDIIECNGFAVGTIPDHIMELCTSELVSTMMAVVDKTGKDLFQIPDNENIVENVMFSETRKMADFAGCFFSSFDIFSLGYFCHCN
jgi:hypothetical protein